MFKYLYEYLKKNNISKKNIQYTYKANNRSNEYTNNFLLNKFLVFTKDKKTMFEKVERGVKMKLVQKNDDFRTGFHFGENLVTFIVSK